MSNMTLKQWRKTVRWPWRKQAVFEKSPRHFWEIFAVIISMLALIVSAVATVGTWRQTDVMKEQLTAADRNTGSLKISEAVVNACRVIRDGPVRARKWKYYRGADDRPAKIPVINNVEFKISLQQREEYGNALEDLQFQLGAVGLYRAFANERQATFYTDLITEISSSIDDAIAIVDDSQEDFDYVRLRAVGENCSVSITNSVMDLLGPKVTWPAIVVEPTFRILLEPIPDTLKDGGP